MVESLELSVSGDGTWYKRGYTSLYDVVSIIGHYTSAVVDIIVKHSYCKMFKYWKSKTNTARVEEWSAMYKYACSASHDGTSGKMEVDVIVEIFKRSRGNILCEIR